MPTTKSVGMLASQFGYMQPVGVHRSAAGFYIGVVDEIGMPISRESAEYWRTREAAEAALAEGHWTQRLYP